jgi:hypothetical protein
LLVVFTRCFAYTCRTKTEVDYATNSVGPAAATAEPVLTVEEVEGYVDACDVGQLEACAAQRITDSQDGAAGPSSMGAAAAAAPDSVRGTPYSSPSGRWSNFKSYGTFRVRTLFLLGVLTAMPEAVCIANWDLGAGVACKLFE